MIPSKSRDTFILNLFGFLVKCTSSYFLEAKVAPCVLAHLRQIS